MKNLFNLLLVGLIVSGCSKSDEVAKGETLGKDIADRMKAPIEKTQSVTDKIQRTRAVELPE